VVVDRRTRTVDFDDHADLTITDATRTAGDAVTPADPAHPATLLFCSVDLTGAVRVEAEVSRTGDEPGGAALEFHVDDRFRVRIEVPPTGDRYAWSTVGCRLPVALDGVHDLRLTLHGDVRAAAFRFASAHPAEG
jgi:beta-glucosidase